MVLPRPTSSASSIRIGSVRDASRQRAELVRQRVDDRLRRRDERPRREGIRDPRRCSEAAISASTVVGSGAVSRSPAVTTRHPPGGRVPDADALDAERLGDLDDLDRLHRWTDCGASPLPSPGALARDRVVVVHQQGRILLDDLVGESLGRGR